MKTFTLSLLIVFNKLTAFPPAVSKWYDVGTDWVGGSLGMDMLQNLYPIPPNGIFLSDDEADKALWVEAESDNDTWICTAQPTANRWTVAVLAATRTAGAIFGSVQTGR
jgi:hypothetical protein